MNAILISEKNKAAIEAVLRATNGHATAHTYNRFEEIIAAAEKAEKAAVELLGSKKAAIGAAWEQTSGERVANSYDRCARTRIATTITLTRRPSGWFLTSVEAATIYKKGGNKGVICLNDEQEVVAISVLRNKYRKI
jgi:hypothetical protein